MAYLTYGHSLLLTPNGQFALDTSSKFWHASGIFKVYTANRGFGYNNNNYFYSAVPEIHYGKNLPSSWIGSMNYCFSSDYNNEFSSHTTNSAFVASGKFNPGEYNLRWSLGANYRLSANSAGTAASTQGTMNQVMAYYPVKMVAPYGYPQPTASYWAPISSISGIPKTINSTAVGNQYGSWTGNAEVLSHTSNSATMPAWYLFMYVKVHIE